MRHFGHLASRRPDVVAVRHRPTVKVELDGQEHSVDPMQVQALRLLELFGSKAAMADYFGAARSQPGRWVRGDAPVGATAVLLTDLSYVWDRATEDQPDEAVRIWLRSPNALLGQPPLEAVAAGRAGAVVAAWDAYMEGSFV
jgi:hypothetical protein